MDVQKMLADENCMQQAQEVVSCYIPSNFHNTVLQLQLKPFIGCYYVQTPLGFRHKMTLWA